jgi:hypothetical protein
MDREGLDRSLQYKDMIRRDPWVIKQKKWKPNKLGESTWVMVSGKVVQRKITAELGVRGQQVFWWE